MLCLIQTFTKTCIKSGHRYLQEMSRGCICVQHGRATDVLSAQKGYPPDVLGRILVNWVIFIAFVNLLGTQTLGLFVSFSITVEENFCGGQVRLGRLS